MTRPSTAWPVAALAAGCAVAAGACGGEGAPSLQELTAPGVSRDLARWRAASIDSLRYDLAFRVPAERTEPIDGTARIRFRLTDRTRPVVLDFAASDSAVRSVTSRGEQVEYRLDGGHLVIPAGEVTAEDGAATVEIEFQAGDGPLNRNDEYLYTLFVPARAREAFPCFDQPDLKGRFQLTLEAPADWRVVSNTPRLDGDGGAGRGGTGGEEEGGHRVHRFARTPPLPTYLFSFAAGRFQVETAEMDGRTLRMFHRETDGEKVRRNQERAFRLHATALRWLEEYTGIHHPFQKFDFVLIPSFQYNGMEHPGAVLYRASSVLLDEGATSGEKLGRASLIAHETAHMWFGDLVTMEWFNDVWMKEVFANFMAARIVHPSFPDIDHDLRFLLDHFPSAYGVDRSEGTHPIRQVLPNLADAGNLYGAIIYQKAPIVMRQLEALVGPDEFRAGVRDYLDAARWGNAGWPELVAALDPHTELDVERWSRVWVEEEGRPVVHAELRSSGSRIGALTLRQEDPAGRGRRWPQRVAVGLGEEDNVVVLRARLEGDSARIPEAAGRAVPGFVLPGAEGFGYGRFELADEDRRRLLGRLPHIQDPVVRGAAWLALWDDMLEGRTPPETMVRSALELVPAEPHDPFAERLLADVVTAWWRYLGASTRESLAPELEEALWRALTEAGRASRKAALFTAYRDAAITDAALSRLEAIWRERDPPAGLPMAERDYSELAQALAVRRPEDAARILGVQLDRIENPDRRERFRWVMPALSPEPAVRDSFFSSLAEPANRRHEPWVVEGLSWLHHPLRARASRRYVEPALELLREVQATGDIFFPGRWLDATLSGHSSPEVAATVRGFLAARPDYPGFLEDKILQAADPVFRASRIRGGG